MAPTPRRTPASHSRQSLTGSQTSAQDPRVAVATSEVTLEGPVSFGLTELMSLLTAVGVSLGLVRAFNVFGLMLFFISAGVFSAWMYSFKSLPHNRPAWLSETKRIWIHDFIWAIHMPILVIVTGQWEFADRRRGVSVGMVGAAEWDWSLLTFIGLQLLAMMLWLVAGRRIRVLGALMCGWLLGGGLVLGGFWLILLLPSLMLFFMFGLGMLGFAPCLACWSFLRRSCQAWVVVREQGHWRWLLFALGLGIAWGVPWLVASWSSASRGVWISPLF